MVLAVDGRIENAAADHCPARLIIMNVGGFDDGDIEIGLPAPAGLTRRRYLPHRLQ